MEQRIKTFRGRIHCPVGIDDVKPGDVIFYIDNGSHCSIVKSVAKSSVMVRRAKGLSPPTKRVPKSSIKEVWRWHKKLRERDEEKASDPN